MNEGFGKDFYRKGNSVKRSGPFSEPPDSENRKVAVLIPCPMTSSERPSPEPFLKKEASPAVLRGREVWKCSGSLKCPEFSGLGIPAVLSRGIPGNALRAFPFRGLSGILRVFPGSFRNFPEFLPETVLGVWPKYPKQLSHTCLP